MGIGPSTKETSLHHFRDPLLDVVSNDTDLDLMGILLVGTPDDNKDKMLVGTRSAVWAEAMRADGVIRSRCDHLFGRLGKQRRGFHEYMRAARNQGNSGNRA